MGNEKEHSFVAISYDGAEYWFAAKDLANAEAIAKWWFGKYGKTLMMVKFERDHLADIDEENMR